jgi:hypothetical protein
MILVPPLRVAPQIAEQWVGEALYLARLPAGPILVLDAVGGLIWNEVTTGSADGVIDRVAAQLDVDGEHIASHVLAFVDDLITRGLLIDIEDGLGY